MTEEKPPPRAVTDYAEALKEIFDRRRPRLSMGAAAQAWGVNKSTVSRALSGAKSTIASPGLVEKIISFRYEPDAEMMKLVEKLPQLRRKALQARDQETDRVVLLREQVGDLQTEVEALTGKLNSTKSDNSRLGSQVSSLTAKAEALRQRAQREAEQAAEAQRQRRLAQQRADQERQRADCEAAERQKAEGRARQAEQGAAESLTRFNDAEKRLAGAQRYAFESGATIDELRRQLEERDEQLRLLQTELKTLQNQVAKLLTEQKRMTDAVAETAATQASAPAVHIRPPGQTDGPSARVPVRPRPAPGSYDPLGGWWEGGDSPITLNDLEELFQDGKPPSPRSAPAPAPGLGQRLATAVRKEFSYSLLWDALIALSLTQGLSFVCLLGHTMTDSGKIPGWRTWLVFGCMAIAAAAAWLLAKSFSRSKIFAQCSVALILACGVLAGFGTDTLTQPALAHEAEKLGAEWAERGDGKSCDVSFCARPFE